MKPQYQHTHGESSKAESILGVHMWHSHFPPSQIENGNVKRALELNYYKFNLYNEYENGYSNDMPIKKVNIDVVNVNMQK